MKILILLVVKLNKIKYEKYIVGTRIEHDTEKTLRQYLTENGVNLEKL